MLLHWRSHLLIGIYIHVLYIATWHVYINPPVCCDNWLFHLLFLVCMTTRPWTRPICGWGCHISTCISYCNKVVMNINFISPLHMHTTKCNERKMWVYKCTKIFTKLWVTKTNIYITPIWQNKWSVSLVHEWLWWWSVMHDKDSEEKS